MAFWRIILEIFHQFVSRMNLQPSLNQQCLTFLHSLWSKKSKKSFKEFRLFNLNENLIPKKRSPFILSLSDSKKDLIPTKMYFFALWHLQLPFSSIFCCRLYFVGSNKLTGIINFTSLEMICMKMMSSDPRNLRCVIKL